MSAVPLVGLVAAFGKATGGLFTFSASVISTINGFKKDYVTFGFGQVSYTNGYELTLKSNVSTNGTATATGDMLEVRVYYSNTYNNFETVSAPSIPTTGRWKSGTFVSKSNRTASGNTVLWGWVRLTTGENNVSGTDWLPVYQTSSNVIGDICSTCTNVWTSGADTFKLPVYTQSVFPYTGSTYNLGGSSNYYLNAFINNGSITNVVSNSTKSNAYRSNGANILFGNASTNYGYMDESTGTWIYAPSGNFPYVPPGAAAWWNYSNKGILIPRGVTSNMTGISNPNNGLLFFNTDSVTNGGFMYRDSVNAVWRKLGMANNYPVHQDITTGTSSTVTSNRGVTWVNFNPASTISSYTLTFPASPQDGDIVQITGGGTITSGAVVTTITFSFPSGVLQSGTPTGLNVGGQYKYQYNSSTGKWHNLGF